MDINNIKSEMRGKGVAISDNDPLFIYAEINDEVLQSLLKPKLPLNKNLMRSKLGAKGIRVTDDDPIFSLLTINSIVLCHAIPKIQKLAVDEWRDKNGDQGHPNTGHWKIAAAASGAALVLSVVAGITSIPYFFTSAIGLISGIAIMALLKINSKTTLQQIQIKEEISQESFGKGCWTESEFSRVISLIRPKPSDRMMSACRSVLIDKISTTTAAKNEQMFQQPIENLITKLNERR